MARPAWPCPAFVGPFWGARYVKNCFAPDAWRVCSFLRSWDPGQKKGGLSLLLSGEPLLGLYLYIHRTLSCRAFKWWVMGSWPLVRRKITPAGNIIFSFHLLISLLPAKHPRALGLCACQPEPCNYTLWHPHPPPPPPARTGKPDFLKEKRNLIRGTEFGLCFQRSMGWSGITSWPEDPEREASGLCLSAGGQLLPILAPLLRCHSVDSRRCRLKHRSCPGVLGVVSHPQNGEGEGLIRVIRVFITRKFRLL